MKNLVLLLMLLITATGFAQKMDAELGNEETPKEEKVYTIIEEMPVFPGGQEGLFAYLRSNMKYPKEAKARGEHGRVIVKFVINKKGEVVDVNVIKSVSTDLDNEAIRVVKEMPNWKPGTQSGVPVMVSYNLPLSFKLPKDKNIIQEETINNIMNILEKGTPKEAYGYFVITKKIKSLLDESVIEIAKVKSSTKLSVIKTWDDNIITYRCRYSNKNGSLFQVDFNYLKNKKESKIVDVNIKKEKLLKKERKERMESTSIPPPPPPPGN